MYSSTIYLVVFLVFIHNATPKIYVIDLTGEGTDSNDVIELRKLLKHFKKPEENLSKEEESDSKELRSKSSVEVECLMSLGTTKAEKLRCLEHLDNKKSVGRQSFYYPDYHHEFYTQRPKRTIYSMFNYYGGLLKTKPFTDLTRQEFSQDYLDIGELSRIADLPDAPSLDQDNDRKLRVKISDLIPKAIARRNIKRGKRKRRHSSEESDSSDSDRGDRRDRKHRKPNRFQVVFNGDSSQESEEKREKPQKSFSSESEENEKEMKRRESNSESESEEVTPRPRKSKEKYSYLQGNKYYDGFRRRLQHFMPKRFHWDEDDIHHLGYYWFDGPRGKYS